MCHVVMNSTNKRLLEESNACETLFFINFFYIQLNSSQNFRWHHYVLTWVTMQRHAMSVMPKLLTILH